MSGEFYTVQSMSNRRQENIKDISNNLFGFIVTYDEDECEELNSTLCIRAYERIEDIPTEYLMDSEDKLTLNILKLKDGKVMNLGNLLLAIVDRYELYESIQIN